MTGTLSTLALVVNTPRTVAQLQHLLRDTSNPREELRNLINYFKSLAAGHESASFTVQTSASVPAYASSTFTLTYGSLANGTSTCVIGATTLTAETSPSGQVQFGIGANLAAATTNLTACINANTTLNKYVVATGATSTGVVTVSALTPGVIANFVTFTGGTGIVAANATLVGGTGGMETAVVTFNKGR